MSENKNETIEQQEEVDAPKVESQESKKVSPKKSPIKLITRIVLIVAVFFFIWYVSSERHTPYTDQARIKGLITPVSPRVAGYVTDVNYLPS